MPLIRFICFFRIHIFLLLILTISSPSVDGETVGRPEPKAGAGTELTNLPLRVRSEERGKVVRALIEGHMNLPFADVAAALADPVTWCDFLPLTLNVKSCTWRQDGEGMFLSIYAGRKGYQLPEEATRLDYRFQLEESSTRRLTIKLEASKGPLGIREGSILLTATPEGEGTALRLVSSLKSSLRSRLATDTYLATLGREKVGFSVIGKGPQLVRGVRGMIERNAMRYYLALQAYLDTRELSPGERFEARLNRWFDLSENYRRQLHEMDKDEYLSAKRRERMEQARLQGELMERSR